MKKSLKKYLIIRFKFYYILAVAIYILQPISQILKDIIYYDGNDTYDFAICILTGLVCMFLLIFVIIPTVSLFKMNANRSWKEYWYQAVFEKEKVYGTTRKFMIIIVLIYVLIKICVLIERLCLDRPVFTENSFDSFISMMNSFGLTAIMSGIFLELRKNKERYIYGR